MEYKLSHFELSNEENHLPIKGNSLTALGVVSASRSNKMKKPTKMFIPEKGKATLVMHGNLIFDILSKLVLSLRIFHGCPFWSLLKLNRKGKQVEKLWRHQQPLLKKVQLFCYLDFLLTRNRIQQHYRFLMSTIESHVYIRSYLVWIPIRHYLFKYETSIIPD